MLTKTKPSPRLYARHGFTIVELLAVVVVVAILASLLIAALNSAQNKAHRVLCLNSLKQLQGAWMIYVDDNQGNLPLNRSVPSFNTILFGRRNTTNSWVAGNPKEDTTADNIKLGTLYRYIGSTQVYRCPSDDSRVLGKKKFVRTRSYSMSEYLNGDEAGANPRVKTKLSELTVPAPSEVFVFIEEYEYSVWGGAFVVTPRASFSHPGRTWTSTPSDRHNRGGNLSFSDGHIEHWNWKWAREADAGGGPALARVDDRDRRRLEAASPR